MVKVSGVTKLEEYKQIEIELRGLLSGSFPGIEVEAQRSARWDRPCVTFRWAGFESLLPEERFHRLVQVIPEDFRKRRLAGFIWLELAAAETVDSFLKCPRSEDHAEDEPNIHAGLQKAGFFDALRAALGEQPAQRCAGGFTQTAETLIAQGFTPTQIRDAKLVFIRLGVYCDCQVLEHAQAELAQRYLQTG